MSQSYTYWKWGNGGLMAKSLRKQPALSQIDKKLAEREVNTREINYTRIGDRELVIQTSINPYLATNNYLEDLSVQDKFLRPKDSNVKSEAQ